MRNHIPVTTSDDEALPEIRVEASDKINRWRNKLDRAAKINKRKTFERAADDLFIEAEYEFDPAGVQAIYDEVYFLGRDYAGLNDDDIQYIMEGAKDKAERFGNPAADDKLNGADTNSTDINPPPQQSEINPPPPQTNPEPPPSSEADYGFEGSGDRTNELPPEAEDAIALVFAERHAGELRYVNAWGRWISFEGAHWIEDNTLHTFDRARTICREIAAAGEYSPRAVASAKTIVAVERLASADRRLAATAEQWDDNSWMLNEKTGNDDGNL